MVVVLCFLIQSEVSDRVRELEARLERLNSEIHKVDKELKELTFFDGTIDAWKGNKELWRVENGEIVGTSKGLKRNEFLWRDMTLGDFRLIVEVKLVPNNGNSGIQFRSKPRKDGEAIGYQADIGETWWGRLYEESRRGLLTKESRDAYARPGEWNTYEILATGSRVQMALNGNLCVDLDDPKGAREGSIALQLHSGDAMEIRFRKLQLEVNPKPVLVTLQY
jgi:hypothetical protein